MKRTRTLALVVALASTAALSGHAAASSPPGDAPVDLAGMEVNVLTPETGSEVVGFITGLQPFMDETGVIVNVNSTRDATTELNISLEAGDPPNIAMIPQPGRIQQFCTDGSAIPVPQGTIDALFDQYDEFWWDLGASDDGTYCGVPEKGDVKSLVWYNTAIFAENGYEIPETFDALIELQEQIKADGLTPWCVGIASGDATGWPFTDWVEDMLLRLHGPEVYDQWVNHEIPFNDERVAEAVQAVADIWFGEGNVYGGRDAIASTGFRDIALPMINGDCVLHRQASFAAAFFTENGATVGPEGDIDAFYFPTVSDEFGTVVLGAGVHAVAFTDDPATLALLEYLGTAEHAEARIESAVGGYLSPNTTHDTSLYPSPIETTFADILVSADPFRFDASDLMPGEVGSGSFWQEGTEFVSGAQELTDFLDAVEESWPS